MKQMIMPDEASKIVQSQVWVLAIETVAHEAALGRTPARDIVSRVDLPPFDNSSMDGYALIASDVKNASETSPVVLHVLETIGAGSAPQKRVEAGACSKIMTGAPLPQGADAVVMREETSDGAAVINAETQNTRVTTASKTEAETRAAQSQNVLLTAALADAALADESFLNEPYSDDVPRVSIMAVANVGQNIRCAGSDVRRGEVVMAAGGLIRSAQWAMLASLDEASVEVFRRPRVAILTSGDELVGIGEELLPGRIRDSNSFALAALVQSCGGVVAVRRHVRDDADALRAALLECAAHCDAIITSGGVSAGDFDPVRDVLPLVADVHFWKIAMKPGKPVMFATMRAMTNAAVTNAAVTNAAVTNAADDGAPLDLNGSSPFGAREDSGEHFGKPSRVVQENDAAPTHEYSCAAVGSAVPVFGLPGNPVSVMVAFEQFVRPALLKMQGRTARRRVTLRARVESGFDSPQGKVEFIRALVLPDAGALDAKDGDGFNRWSARVASDQGSGRLSTMTGANALLVVPADRTRVEAGDVLDAQMIAWPEIA